MADFEKFMEESFGDLVDRRHALNGDKEYMSWDMAIAWFTWRESRAVLVVELPEKFEVERGAYGTTEVVSVAELKIALRAAGITVRDE